MPVNRLLRLYEQGKRAIITVYTTQPETRPHFTIRQITA